MPARRVIVSPQGLGLAITTSSLPVGTPSVAYSFGLTSVGGTGATSWTLQSQTGLNTWSVSSSGVLTGTPTHTETDTVTVAVVDSLLNHVTRPLSLTVGVPVSITTTSPLPGATQAVAYSDTMAATGGTTPYTWSLTSQTGSNTWAVSSSGVVTGTPTVVETDTLVIKVTDNAGGTASGSFNVAVSAAGAFNFYISPTGNDGNVGSLASPWAITSLQSGNANRTHMTAGTKIGLLSGTYNVAGLVGAGDFTTPLFDMPAGTTSAPVIIQSVVPRGAIVQYQNFANLTQFWPLFGQNPASSGNFILDGIVMDLTGSNMRGFYVNYTSGYTNFFVIQNCECFGQVFTQPGQNPCQWGAQHVGPGTIFQNNYGHDFSVSSSPDHCHTFYLYNCHGAQVIFNTGANGPQFFDGKTDDDGCIVAYNYVYNYTYAAIEGFDGDQSHNPALPAYSVHHNIFHSCPNTHRPDVNTITWQGLNWYNNTTYDTSASNTNVVDLRAQSSALVQHYNNIYVTTGNPGGSAGGYGIIAFAASTTWTINDFNCYFPHALGSFWGQNTGVNLYSTFATWKGSPGSPDAHGIQANPQFSATIVPAGGPTQFQLGGGSPCLGSGQGGVNMGAWDGTVTQIGADWVTYPVT